MRSSTGSTKAATLAVLALAFPLLALADRSGTQALTANTSLNLDTGVVVASSGGDILWTTTSITPQANATAYNITQTNGAALFPTFNQTNLAAFAINYSKSPISAGILTVGDLFAVHTNGGNYAAVLVKAVGGGSITLQFNTFGSTGASAGPVITNVENNYGEIPAGFPNSGIAQGALFFIVGTGLADPSAPAVLQSSTAVNGLPTTLNGASVQVTVNGTTTIPVFYYAVAGALGLVLPSNTPIGAGQITVTYNGTASAPFSIQVVQSVMGFDAYYGTGTGLGVATNSVSGVLYNYNNSIPQGTNVTLWGSGLGADPTRDAKYSVANIATINGLAHIYVGGLDAAILHQGPSGFPA